MTKEHDPKAKTADPGSDNGRKDHIRRWIDGKMRRWVGRGIAGGLGSTLMALPALAQATIEELYAYQFAETIPGVQSVKLLKNGDVLLKMIDGSTMIVAAENVQVLDSGAIMIAENAVSEIAQFSLAAEAGGAAAAGGGISGVGAALGGLGLAGAAAAGAGGGGGGDDGDFQPAPPAPPQVLNLAQAQSTALSSTEANIRVPDGTETVELTIGSLVKSVPLNPDGSWSISLTAVEAASLPQGVQNVTVRHLDSGGRELSVETVSYNIDTIPPTLTISGLSDGAVINAAESATDLTVSGTTNAENGQTVTVTLNGGTYSSTVTDGQWAVTVPASDLAALPDGETIVLTADVSDMAGNPAAQVSDCIETDFTAPTVTLDPLPVDKIELVDVQNDMELSGSTTAADGRAVFVEFGGQTYSTTASDGSWSVTIPSADLASLPSGTPVSIRVVVSDEAGNTSVPATTSVPVDLTGPAISISPLSVGSAVNAAEVGSDLTISGITGNVEDGQQVTVVLDGQSYTGAVFGNSWSVTIPAADLGALADGGTFTITANVSNTDGLAANQANAPVSKDVTAPTLTIDGYSDGAVLNAAERDTDLTITGSTDAEDGQTVTVSLNGQDYTGTVAGGVWSATVPAADLTALSDGATIPVTADVADAAGNPALQASGSFDTDFSPHSITITNLSDGPVMNLAERGTDLTVSGTSDAPDGTTITVEIVRADGTVDLSNTTTVSGGTWTLVSSAAGLNALQDDEIYSVNATVSDTAGNSASASDGFGTDFTAPTVTINPLAVGSVLDVSEKGNDLSISGATSAEEGQIVTVMLDGQSYTGVATGGTWSVTVPAADLSGLADSTNFPISATVSDQAGNSASPATTTLATDFRPLLDLNSIGANNSISLGDAQSSGVVVSGTSVGLAAGQAVNVTLNSNSVGTATVAADGTWSLAVPASDFTGISAGDDLNFQAQATVSGGPDPLPATGETTAHVPGAYVIAEAGRSGSTITYQIFADADRDVSSGLAMTIELGFDPSVVTFDAGSDIGNGAFGLYLSNPVGGSVVNFAGVATSFTDLNQPLVTFTMTVQDPSKPVELSLTTPDGGPTTVIVGTDGNDTLVASDVDSFVRGQGGDDAINVSDAGRDVVVFEAAPAANGVDTITGFSLGAAADVSDALMLSGLDHSTLRGDGTDVETLNVGSAVGANTGVIGLTTALADLSINTIETAVESLTGLQAGDEIYVLATDGDDSVLVRVDYSSPTAATVETMAHFSGLDDLSGLSADNILIADPTGATA
ncbi:Ig-like domain-containing protein [Ruegeria atlantica]|uniref:Ig-like domain-containing protein n=1 Tax=Ruegeria atlantica TaxID=81569 RepID=UPI0024940780|nr:Ig-like domain-containing protein [Ruegeria atlantica]